MASTITTPASPDTRHPAASAHDVVKVYGRGPAAVRALDGVTLDIPSGRFTAIMGPSGSGKSTLLHCLAGLDDIDGGTIRIDDTDVAALTERRRTLLRRYRVGFVFQSFNLIPTLSALENIALPLTLAGRRPEAAWVDPLIDTLGLRNRLHHRPAELSGGQQQRVAVARALVARPALVFADEPTGNLDSRHGNQLLALLRHTVDELAQTIVMVTHDPAAASWADRVVFLADGRIVDDLDTPTIDAVLVRMKRLDAPTVTGDA